MTKLLAIGDLHGKDVWRELDPESFDKVVFIGDYVDSFDKSNMEIIENLNSLIEFKKDNPDNVILLIGNHDLQYFPKYGYPRYGCSGYRPEIYPHLLNIFSDNRKEFQYSYQICDELNNFLFTHAGVSNKWYKKIFLPEVEQAFIDIDENICLADKMNTLFLEHNDILTQVGWERGGEHELGSPLWADRREFTSRGVPLKGFYQIAGHSPVRDFITHSTDTDTRITFIDCLDTVVKGYKISI